MATIEGQKNDFRRVVTGLYSIDRLLSNRMTGKIGFPTQTLVEVYGYPGQGKTTLTQFLSGRIAQLTGHSVIRALDLEAAYDETHLESNLNNSGFTGTFELIPTLSKSGDMLPHEDLMEDLVKSLSKKDVGVGIIDSLGMVMSQAEVDNPIGSANWGKRAMIINQMCRKALAHIRGKSKVLFLVNHQYPEMGGKGHTTPGGQGKEFAVALRLTLWRAEIFSDGSMAIRVKAEKMRYGGMQPKHTALVGIIPGQGVSPLLTNMLDALDLGVVERDKRGFVRVNGTNLGRVGSLTKWAAEGRTEKFDAFQEALNNADVTEEEGEDNE